MPEEVINKLVPIRPQTKTKAAQKIEEKVTGVDT